jgi:hypothetical protein
MTVNGVIKSNAAKAAGTPKFPAGLTLHARGRSVDSDLTRPLTSGRPQRVPLRGAGLKPPQEAVSRSPRENGREEAMVQTQMNRKEHGNAAGAAYSVPRGGRAASKETRSKVVIPRPATHGSATGSHLGARQGTGPRSTAVPMNTSERALAAAVTPRLASPIALVGYASLGGCGALRLALP